MPRPTGATTVAVINRRTAIITLIATLVTTAVTVGGALIIYVDRWVGLLYSPSVTIEQTAVTNNPDSQQTRLINADGSYDHFDAGELIWLAVRPSGDSTIYPSLRPCATNKNKKVWSCPIAVTTRPSGQQQKFTLIAMRVSALGVNAFLDYALNGAKTFSGLPQLPAGAEEADERDVTVS